MKRSTFRRQFVAVVALLVVTGVAVVGWVAGSRVQSPESAAARAAPPDPSLITAPVELRILSSRVVDRGNVVPGQSATVTGPTSEEGATITGVPVEVGDELLEGDLVVVVSGRPVVVMEGAVPAYRPIRPGMRGTDVDQLQASLGRLNCDTSADEGVYGEATKECVARLYEALGYETVPASETEAKDLSEAEDAVATAEQQLQEAQSALDKASEGPTASELLEQEQAVDAARRKVEDTAQSGIASRAEAAAAVDASVMALNAFLADRASKPSDRAKAEDELEAAVLKAETTENEVVEASAAAEEALELAEAKLEEMQAPKDVESETAVRDQAQETYERAVRAFEDLQAVSGPMVPLGEVVFVSALPATVNSLSADVGEAVNNTSDDGFGQPSSNGLAVLATSALQVEALISPTDAELLEVGMEVELINDVLGSDPIVGTLETLGEQVVSSENNEDRGLRAVITADGIPRSWTGTNVRVTFTSAATSGSVLVVPVAALSSAADGQARVEVQNDDGTLTSVPVDAGLSTEGFVEVTPVGDGELNEGDLVVVGSNA